MRSRRLLSILVPLLVAPSWLSGCDERDVVSLGDVSALTPDANASDASVPEPLPVADASDAATQTGLAPDSGDGGNPDELICSGVDDPMAISTGVLPPCEEPFPAKTSADCAALGLRLSLAIKQCVEDCLDSEQLSGADCCVFGVDGRCCPSGTFDDEQECIIDNPGTSGGSGPNPCGAGRHITCTRSGSCRCVRN
ncbi:MAG: hypothetical protein RL033_3525 [Pseudomonadota bacterium]|jgi:hypothetical protein